MHCDAVLVHFAEFEQSPFQRLTQTAFGAGVHDRTDLLHRDCQLACSSLFGLGHEPVREEEQTQVQLFELARVTDTHQVLEDFLQFVQPCFENCSVDVGVGEPVGRHTLALDAFQDLIHSGVVSLFVFQKGFGQCSVALD